MGNVHRCPRWTDTHETKRDIVHLGAPNRYADTVRPVHRPSHGSHTCLMITVRRRPVAVAAPLPARAIARALVLHVTCASAALWAVEPPLTATGPSRIQSRREARSDRK